MNLPAVYAHLRSGGTLRLQLTDSAAHDELCARLQMLAMKEGLFLRVTEHPRIGVLYIRLMQPYSFDRVSA